MRSSDRAAGPGLKSAKKRAARPWDGSLWLRQGDSRGCSGPFLRTAQIAQQRDVRTLPGIVAAIRHGQIAGHLGVPQIVRISGGIEPSIGAWSHLLHG